MKTYKSFLILILSGLSLGQLSASKPEVSIITDSKSWSETFDVNAGAQVNLSCRESDVNITTWDQNTVEVKVTLVVEAYEQDELEKLFKAFAPSISGSSSEVNIKNPDGVSETVNNNKTRIKINNEVIKVKSYRYKINIKMPKLNHLNARVRFSIVNLGKHAGRVNLELYECSVDAAELNSDEAKIDIKFSKGVMGSARTMKLQTYESELDFDTVRTLNMDAKFSKINFQQVRDSRVNAYESDVDLGFTRTVKLKHNFGSFKMGDATSVELDVYEMKFVAGNVQMVDISSGRFSKITFGATKHLDVQAAYESEISVAETDSLTIDARFCKVHVGRLNQVFIAKSYESDFQLNNVRSGFRKIEIDGRFTNADIHLLGKERYQLEAEMSFGDLAIPTEDNSRIKISKVGTNLKASSYPEDSSSNSKIRLKGYETDVKIERL